MLANLLDIDEAMLLGALRGDGPMIVFYDFATAFPSIEHDLLTDLFKSLGWPEWLLNMVNRLYSRNFRQIVLGGIRFDGCDLTRGIRQGCPLSPLLFAVTSDLFLRRLARLFLASTRRAWADDLPMVVDQALIKLPDLQNFFQDFARISGLHLNIGKTVLVPLAPFNRDELRRLVQSRVQAWRDMVIADAAKYLVVFVGWSGQSGFLLESAISPQRHTEYTSHRSYNSSVSWRRFRAIFENLR